VSNAEIERLRAAGAAGLRLNVVTLGRTALEAMRPQLHAFAETGFIIQLECPATILEEVAPLLSPEIGPVVLDHFARPSIEHGTDAGTFAAVLALAERGAVVKLSGAFRVSQAPFPHADLDPFMAELRRRVPPTHFIWGSDWPFLAMDVRPTYQSTLAMLDRWFPVAEDRRRILADNPARLFGFDA
jgi:2-pyrone-4,6-dicarboxylate lactonase